MPAISQRRFEALKRQAKRLQKSSLDLTHSQALDQIARDVGFNNWSLLAREINSEPQNYPAGEQRRSADTMPHTVVLYGIVWSRDPTSRWFWREHVGTRYTEDRYTSCPWIPEDWRFRDNREDRIRQRMAKARRALAFMDATGLRPSKAFVRIFKRREIPSGFDHTSIWRTEEQRYIVMTEPYAGTARGAVRDWCESEGWACVEMPNGQGVWNPCSPACGYCGGHTRMLIMSPPKIGADASLIAEAILRCPSEASVLKTEVMRR